MKPSKAIEILKDLDETYSYTHFPDRKDALKLGIEALKLYQRSKEAGWRIPSYKLPGETPEDE